MKNKYLIAVMIALLAWFIALSVVSAQDELTLEDLAEGLNVAMQSIGLLAERVTALEGKLMPVTTENGVCIQHSAGQLQRETATKFFDKYEENVGSLIHLRGVHYDTENGLTIFYFNEGFSNRTVTETWRSCEFIGSSDWRMGRRIERRAGQPPVRLRASTTSHKSG